MASRSPAMLLLLVWALFAGAASLAAPADAGPSPRAAWREPGGPSATPIRDGVTFSAEITNRYLPLSTVRYTVLAGGGERVVREVLDQTRAVGGVECLVLAEREFEDGELVEVSLNFFAQDGAGHVYYFGEEVDEYAGGSVVGHGGAWMVGRNAAEPCLFMPARPARGLAFKPENSPPEAEEWARVESIDASIRVPAGEFERVVVVQESDHPDRWEERKYYAPGLGLVSENGRLNLVELRAVDRPAGPGDDDDDEDGADKDDDDDDDVDPAGRSKP